MVKKTIQIYCRLKPSTSSASELFGIDEDGDGNPLLAFSVPKDLSSGLINNKRDTYRFRFDQIFDQSTKQENVFDLISKPVIENVLSGYNGTIFAYGQTGSGKTFTITGGAERYADRGIIPRSLSYIFKYYEAHSNFEYTTHISYLEIYNDAGYDLLDPRHEAAKLEDLPKVNLLEDRDGNIHLRNLSFHLASNEEDALNLLFLGDTNRMIAETPMNQASTRSHCIFTIHITTKDPTTATIRRSKLHLVDLAGSERVSKTGVTGTLLSEAKYINVSLHFLEQVIIALSERSRSHIPYRNSMMTSVLRDSLGGNCMTTMIATCSVEKRNIDESISTCRFAQRVAMIKNDATLNEEIDPKLVIERLKREVQQLKDELAMANGTEYDEELTEEIRKSLWETVRIYLEDNDPDSTLSVGADMRKINCCYTYMKEFYRKKIPDNESSPDSARQETSALDRVDNNYLSSVTEARKLKELILQRDNEINILVSMLKKERQKAVHPERNTSSGREMRDQTAALNNDVGVGYRDGYKKDMITEDESYRREYSSSQSMKLRQSSQQRDESSEGRRTAAGSDSVDPRNHANENSQMSVARQEAFDNFKRTYRHNQTIQEQKQALKERYTEARSLGEQVNESRKSINVLKSRIEQQRVRHSMHGLTGDVASNEPDAEEMRLRELLNREKATYKVAFTNLKSLKTEIEHLQHLLEKAKVQLLKDFELWWAEAANIQNLGNQVPSHSKPAWKTPPVTPDKPLHEILRSARQGQTKSTIGDLPSYSRELRDTVTKHEENQDENRVDAGRMASRLRAEAQLASSLFSGEDARKTALNQLQEKTKQSNSKQLGSFHSQQSGIHLTGDSKTDADIIAFMKARQNLLQNKGRS